MNIALHLTIQSDAFVVVGLTAILCLAVFLISKVIDKADPLAKPKGLILVGILWLSETLDRQVKDNVGKKYSKLLTPYVLTIAMYIFISNILGLFGFTSPTSNWSVTLTLTIITWVMVQIAQLKAGGFGAYMHAFIEPIPVFLPMNIFGKFSTILSMSLRLFGNVLCGGIIMSLIYSFTGFVSDTIVGLFASSGSPFNFVAPVLAPVLHAYFDVFSGFIQTLIFITLTMVFIGNEMTDEMKNS
ncbi:MAG: F0F1 ATP synthase subunit A [Erysipelotrichaceae bacterium]|nr:F0F1 ATP synthase subunit A [Erysipelotrichaceae bacterium]